MSPTIYGTDLTKTPATPHVVFELAQSHLQCKIIDGLLTEQECKTLIETCTPKIDRSTVVDDTTGEFVLHPDRTSSGTFFRRNENELITSIENRLATLTQIPPENGEGLQVLNYQVGGEYKPHYDYFDPVVPGSHKCLQDGGQRVATVIMYLNMVQDGGETIFPKMGIKVRPKTGSALLFYNMNHKGEINPYSLHGGAPVIQGEKWIMTKWLREYPTSC